MHEIFRIADHDIAALLMPARTGRRVSRHDFQNLAAPTNPGPESRSVNLHERKLQGHGNRTDVRPLVNPGRGQDSFVWLSIPVAFFAFWKEVILEAGDARPKHVVLAGAYCIEAAPQINGMAPTTVEPLIGTVGL